MITIKNLRFYPLTLNLRGQKTLYLGPREEKEISEEDISREVTCAAQEGSLLIYGKEVAPEAGESGEPVSHKRRKPS